MPSRVKKATFFFQSAMDMYIISDPRTRCRVEQNRGLGGGEIGLRERAWSGSNLDEHWRCFLWMGLAALGGDGFSAPFSFVCGWEMEGG